MTWDPSQRPRPPRARAVNRRIPGLGEGSTVYSVPPTILTVEGLQRIIDAAPALKMRAILEHFVVQMSSFYWFWRLSSEPPRSETRYQLRMVAHLVWKAECCGSNPARIRPQLAKHIWASNREAKRLLLEKARTISGKEGSPDYMFFYQDFLDFGLIGRAALEAQAGMKKAGDYANVALAKVIRVMAFTYEFCVGQTPTYSRVEVGPVGIGSARTIGGSSFARFMLAFFREVDPALAATQISNAVARELANARAEEADDPNYFRHLPNLL